MYNRDDTDGQTDIQTDANRQLKTSEPICACAKLHLRMMGWMWMWFKDLTREAKSSLSWYKMERGGQSKGAIWEIDTLAGQFAC